MTRPVATAAEKEFHEKMHAAHMYGLWELASQMTKHPEPKAIPYMWKASLIDALVREAGEAVALGDDQHHDRGDPAFVAGRGGASASAHADCDPLHHGRLGRLHGGRRRARLHGAG